MRLIPSFVLTLIILAFTTGCSTTGGTIDTASAEKIKLQADASLKSLYARTPIARDLAKKAAGILIFPGIVKAGFIGGADYGKGVLKVAGKNAGYYNFVAGSFGLQAGAQAYDSILFFMNKKDLQALDNAKGFEIGVGPTVVALDAGAAKNLTTTTGRADVYSFILNQRGLMGGLNLQGSKISRINP